MTGNGAKSTDHLIINCEGWTTSFFLAIKDFSVKLWRNLDKVEVLFNEIFAKIGEFGLKFF